MAELNIVYHPIGTRGFVADTRDVREVVVIDVIMLMSMDRGFPRHAVSPVEGGELWHDQYRHRQIHLTREAAEADLAAQVRNLQELELKRPRV